QISGILSKELGVGSTMLTRTYPIYIPITYSVIEQFWNDYGVELKLPRVKVSFASRLLVLSKETLKTPITSIGNCVDVMKEFEVFNLVKTDRELPEIETLKRIFVLVARMYDIIWVQRKKHIV